jgi:hypothetical protein
VASRGPTTKALEQRLNVLERNVGALQIDFMVQGFVLDTILVARFQAGPDAEQRIEGFEREILTEISRYRPTKAVDPALLERIRDRARQVLMEALTRVRGKVAPRVSH